MKKIFPLLLISSAKIFGSEIEDILFRDNTLILDFKEKVPPFSSFSIPGENKIVIDIKETLKPERKSYQIKKLVNKVDIFSGPDRGRIILNLAYPVPYTISKEKDKILVIFKKPIEKVLQKIETVDFHRGPRGEGQIVLTLSQPNALVSTRIEGLRILVIFPKTSVPKELHKRWIVRDFGTPVDYFDLKEEGDKAKLTVFVLNKNFDYSVLQTGRVLTIEVRELTPEEAQIRRENKYKGERITLNFQDIPIRQALEVLADFTGLNIVASDDVQGDITLRLHDVPWDQALEVILRSKGLGQFRTDNVIWIAPLEKIQEYEKKRLEQFALEEKQAPLQTEIIQLNYARAEEVAAVLLGTKPLPQTAQQPQVPGVSPAYTTYFPEEPTPATPSAQVPRAQILSERGQVNFDPRTNILIVRDTPFHLEAVRKLVKILDRPVRQVLLESRIVIANDDFTRQLGVRINAARFSGRPGQVQTIIGGRGFPQTTQTGGQQGGTTTGILPNLPNFGVLDFPAGPGAAGIGIAVFKLNQFLMSLELSALQKEGRGEVISMPKVVAQNNTKAKIEQGVEIPFQSQSGLGGTNIQFKKAVMKLEVTPQITPDNKIIMDLLLTKDARGEETPFGPAIDTRKVRTRVQVEDGETVVLGGIFEGERKRFANKVPFFGDLPGIGFAFRRDEVIDNRRELLVFITPRILEEEKPAGGAQ